MVLFIIVSLNAQNKSKQKAEKYLSVKGELTFTFQVDNHNDVDKYTRSLSIVNYDPNTQTVIAWANEKQFRAFESRNIAYQVPQKENEVNEALIYDNPQFTLKNTQANTLTFPLANYPTYADYAQQMQDFEDDNLGLVETFSIGATTEGDKDLLFVKISNNVNTNEQEPKLMLTSSMHGDEIAGYPMMLSLIDHILTVYKNPDPGNPEYNRIQNLVDNSEIWINPNANPDGTYYNSVYPVGHPDEGQSAPNMYVTNSRRANANDVDLNRNYPDNVIGDHPDNEVYQTETIAFMNLAENNHFVLSANFHGGTEVINYPWDNTSTRHPDEDWYFLISKEYAVNCQDAELALDGTSFYMDAIYSNYQWPGVTNGSDWYTVYGGRQDYMNFSHQCKEITIELSNDKILPESNLVDYWLYNKDALLDYLTQGTYGFQGVVKDLETDTPIEATIKMEGHDALGSWTISELPDGDFYRPIKAGTYNILIEAPCYDPIQLNGQIISDGAIIDLGEILLTPKITTPSSLSVNNLQSNSADLSWFGSTESYDLHYKTKGAENWTTISNITTENYNLTGLNPVTDYEFEVRSNCTSTSSSFSEVFEFTTSEISYCSTGGSDISSDYIGIVDINGISNNTVSSTTLGYSDFTGNIIFSDILSLSPDLHTITVTKQWLGNPQKPQAVSAWIDYNQDGIFTVNEKILSSASSTNSTASDSFTIPSTAKAGETVLRVLLKKYNSGTNTQNDPCENYTDGEVEDYKITIQDQTLSDSFIYNLENIAIYPNPFNDILTIKLHNQTDSNSLDIRFFDILGREISVTKFSNSTGSLKLYSNNTLKKGSYFLRITDSNKNSVTKHLIHQ